MRTRRRDKFQRRIYKSRYAGENYQVDLFDTALSTNGEVREFIMCCIDVFSRKCALTKCLGKKTQEVMTAVLECFHKLNPASPPKYVQCDGEGAIWSAQVQELFEDLGIELYNTTNSYHGYGAPIVERLNQTMKNWIVEQYQKVGITKTNLVSFTTENFPLYYNSRVNDTLKMRPNEAWDEANKEKVLNNQLQREHNIYEKVKYKKPTYQIGDYVRLQLDKEQIKRKWTSNFTEDIFKISAILNTIPITYKLVEASDGSEVSGSYYDHQFAKVDFTPSETNTDAITICKHKCKNKATCKHPCCKIQ